MKDCVRGFSFEPSMDVAVDEHEVLKAPTRNGERYALDIAESQFGLYKTIVPWPKSMLSV